MGLVLADFWNVVTDYTHPPALVSSRSRMKVWYLSDAWLCAHLPADRAKWPGFVKEKATTAVAEAMAQLDAVGWKSAPGREVARVPSG